MNLALLEEQELGDNALVQMTGYSNQDDLDVTDIAAYSQDMSDKAGEYTTLAQ
jgi:hypothetical protein